MLQPNLALKKEPNEFYELAHSIEEKIEKNTGFKASCILEGVTINAYMDIPLQTYEGTKNQH